MVAGYHLIWTAYGYWLPNDPRGSTSTEVRVAALEPLGEIHYGRRPVQPPARKIRAVYEKAANLLKHPVLTLDDEGIAIVGAALGLEITERGYTCYACAVMPDHVHLVIRRHRDHAEVMIEHLQAATRGALIAAGKRTVKHPVWAAGPGWKGFLNTRRDFERTIDYIRANPLEIGWPEQRWEFVKVYDGWLPGYRER